MTDKKISGNKFDLHKLEHAEKTSTDIKTVQHELARQNQLKKELKDMMRYMNR